MEGIERGHLQIMPIHAVTEVYGEDGLRELFRIEIEAFPESDRETLLRAERVASRLHAKDRRVREPYVNHLLRVAVRIIRHYQVRDCEVVAAALLHDAVEDHPEDLADLAGAAERALGARRASLAVLSRAFSPRVAELIDAVTNPAYDPARDKGSSTGSTSSPAWRPIPGRAW
ncbi:HD domain-containing protein [Catenulispora yoronensis]